MNTARIKKNILFTTWLTGYTIFCATILSLFFAGEVFSDSKQPPVKNDIPSFLKSSEEGDLESVRTAVKSGINVNAKDENGRTALMFASFNGHASTVSFLLKHGARVNDSDINRRSALIYAASGPYHQTVQELINAGAEIDARDNVEGFTALMFAAAEGQIEVVRTLISAGANKNIKDKDGDRAVDFAGKNGHKKVVKLLAGK